MAWRKAKIDLVVNEELTNVNSGNYQGEKIKELRRYYGHHPQHRQRIAQREACFSGRSFHGTRLLVPDFSAGLALSGR
jgi:hypothetical protein